MTEWIGLGLDIILILVVSAGLVQAGRLIRQLSDLRAGRIEMERFVRDFNAAVMRAEAGIKALRAAARDSGDDLEKLVEKAVMVRDELNFIVESADGVADRLSNAASGMLHAERTTAPKAAPKVEEERQPATAAKPAAPSPVGKPDMSAAAPSSRAEKELLQALQKLS